MINGQEYGKALFMLSNEEGIEEAIFEELGDVARVLSSNPAYVKLLDSPAVSTGEKIKMIDEAFSGVHLYIMNFLKILCEKRSVYAFDACCRGYTEAYDLSANILRATAITAVEMTETQKETLAKKLEQKSGKKVVLENRVDEGIIGGVRLRYGGVQLDGTVSNRLEALRKALESISV